MNIFFTFAAGVFTMFAIKLGFIMLGWWLFMVPVFGLPTLSIIEAIGLNILFNINTLKAEFKR